MAPPELANSGLTVVVVSLAGGPAVERLQASLTSQGAKVVVVAPSAEVSVPMLRMRALEAADTPYVAFLEDTTAPEPSWCAAIREALADPACGAVGGPMTISKGLPPKARALGFCEYAAYQPGRFGELKLRPDGDDVRALPGAAFAVRRADLLPIVQALPHGLFEGEALPRLAQAGKAVRYAHGMASTYAVAYDRGAALATRFQHGRLYAGTRVTGAGAGKRLAYALAAGLLPALLTARTLRRAPGALRGSPATIAWVIAMHTAWALGEFVGYATGRIGDSLKSWS